MVFLSKAIFWDVKSMFTLGGEALGEGLADCEGDALGDAAGLEVGLA